jgi:hypothetical protein
LEWDFATAAAGLIAIAGLALYVLQRKREKLERTERLPRTDRRDAVSLLFVAGPGYRLLEIEPRALAAGSVLDVDGDTYVVERIGPAPLPADHRRCAYVELLRDV